ncbi:MAG: hypothetical protein JF606_24000 [Burkholderiales bacterium]|jgi:glutathione S-transferase|nr:hypothetical protein [Burkholderiales bacterium]
MALIDMLTNRRNTVWCLRMRCRSGGSGLELHQDGVLALAAIHGSGAIATLLLADMSLWNGREPGTLSLTAAIDEYVKAAYQRLIAPRGVPMDRVRIVEWDACGNFDFFATTTVGGYLTHVPVFGLSRVSMPRSREAFISWTGATGAALLASAEREMGGPAMLAAH